MISIHLAFGFRIITAEYFPSIWGRGSESELLCPLPNFHTLKLGATTTAEREALQAVYAYERVLCEKHGKTVHSSRTWQMIKRHGIITAVERAVNRKDVTPDYTALVEMGMSDFAFEAVVCRHPSVFSAETLSGAS